jgi:hypothetical protein
MPERGLLEGVACRAQHVLAPMPADELERDRHVLAREPGREYDGRVAVVVGTDLNNVRILAGAGAQERTRTSTPRGTRT